MSWIRLLFKSKTLRWGLIAGLIAVVWWWKDMQISSLEKDVEIAEQKRAEAEAWAEYLQFNETITDQILEDLRQEQDQVDESANESKEELEAELQKLEQRLAVMLKEAESTNDDPEVRKALEDADRIRQDHAHAVADRVAKRLWSFYCEVEPDQADCAERTTGRRE